MDDNKLKVLQDISYRVERCCGLCDHGVFPNNEWGTCRIQSYQHLKHGDTRQLSIVKFGSCSKFVESIAGVGALGRFKDFMLLSGG